jgi:hypothetical protein
MAELRAVWRGIRCCAALGVICQPRRSASCPRVAKSCLSVRNSVAMPLALAESPAMLSFRPNRLR